MGMPDWRGNDQTRLDSIHPICLEKKDILQLSSKILQVYDIPNIDLDLKVVRTNLPPRTIMRGPGFMDAAMVIEQVLEHAVNYLGSDPEATRRLNFLKAPNEVARQIVKGAYTIK